MGLALIGVVSKELRNVSHMRRDDNLLDIRSICNNNQPDPSFSVTHGDIRNLHSYVEETEQSSASNF